MLIGLVVFFPTRNFNMVAEGFSNDLSLRCKVMYYLTLWNVRSVNLDISVLLTVPFCMSRKRRPADLENTDLKDADLENNDLVLGSDYIGKFQPG